MAAYGALKGLLDFVGYVDLLVTRVTDPGWLGDVTRWQLESPGWVPIASVLSGLVLIWWGMRWPAPLLRGAAPSLRDAQLLFHSAIEPATKDQASIINSLVRGVSRHPNPSVRALIQVFQSKARDTPALGKLANAIRLIDPVNEEELQRRVQLFWNEYREKIHLIRDNVSVAREAGIDVPSQPIFRKWLQDHDRLRERLNDFCSFPEREACRRAIENHGWDDQVIDALRAMLPSGVREVMQ